MVHVRSFLSIIGLVCVMVGSLHAQHANKICSIPNLSGAPLSINAVWVDDSVNFSVEPLAAYPLEVSESGTVDVRVTIKSHDGMPHSTAVHYRDVMGRSAAYTITLIAPQVLSTNGTSQPMQGMPAYPNPAKDYCTVDVDIRLFPNVQVDLFTSSGGRVLGLVKPTADKLIVDTRNLADGKYNVVVSSNGAVIKSEEVVVRH